MPFEYDLTGKQVVIALEPEILSVLKDFGITGTPFVARVHKMDTGGLWVENPHFTICPIDKRKLYGARGETLCTAHVFIPARAIVSVATFPDEIKGLEDNTTFHKIGFAFEEKKRGK